MKIDTFYGDSIFCHNQDEIDNQVSDKDYEQFDRIFTDCIDIVEKDLALDEGANLDIWDSFNTHKKAYRSALSKAHLHMRKHEWTESLQYLTTAKEEINAAKKEVKSTESTMTSAAFGILANAVLTMIMDVIPGMTYLIGIDSSSAIGSEIRKTIALPSVGSKAASKVSKVSKSLIKNDVKAASQIVSAKKKCDALVSYAKKTKVISTTMTILYAVSKIIDDAYSIIKEFREDENNERLTAEKLNIYKNNIVRTLDKFSDTVEKEIKAVREKQKEESRKS